MSLPAILVVDDDHDAADLLGMILGMHLPQATVHLAYGGQAALDLTRRQRPDAAVVDLEMPGLDGEQLAFALRASFPGTEPLLIALSGNVVRLADIEGNGAFDHRLSKPVDVAALVRILEMHL